MTYSIVARDPETGEMGVAVQSHWFSVGPTVPWAEAGVGAVATQALADPAYGPSGLYFMANGRTASEALDELVAADLERDVRQVAMVDAQGNVAAHTGVRCIAAAGHVTGDGYSCQANMMERDTVWGAMAEAYEGADGDLAARLVAALYAAEAEGGDIRGRQSSALLVVRRVDTGQPWEDRLYDVRVDDHPAPVEELDRLLQLHRAYDHMNEYDRKTEDGDAAGAWEDILAAERLAPDSLEVRFWLAVAHVGEGREDEARGILADIYATDPRWAELTRRIARVGLLPDDPALIERLAALE